MYYSLFPLKCMCDLPGIRWLDFSLCFVGGEMVNPVKFRPMLLSITTVKTKRNKYTNQFNILIYSYV